MRRTSPTKTASVLGLLVMLAGSAAQAYGLTKEIVDQATGATALVMVTTEDGPGFGTAFCIDERGLFATDAHVVLPKEGRLQLVIHPGEKDQRVVNAHVVGADSSTDLAVVQADGMGDVPTLRLGNSDQLFATQGVTAFGYPFGDELAVQKNSYPEISVNSGKVTSLRKKDNALYLVQIDAAVNPGNSGGPVINDAGEVVGLVEAGVPGAGVNFAIPVNRLKAMLAKPLIDVEPGMVRWGQRGMKQNFQVQVTSLKNTDTSYAVSFALKKDTEDKEPRTFTGETKQGKWSVMAAPVANATPPPKNSEVTPYVIYDVTLTQNGKTVATTEGPIALSGAPGGGLFSFLGLPGRRGGNAPRGPQDPIPVDTKVLGPVGSSNGTEFRIAQTTEQTMVGLRLTTAKVKGKTILRDASAQWNRNQMRNQAGVLTAKPGYVVGGLNVDATDQYLDAAQVIFIRQNADGTLNAADTYTSDWVGYANNKPEIHTLGGKGEKIVGLVGKKTAGNVINALGLIEELPPEQVQPPGVDEPLAPEKDAARGG